ncbi:hypothetical protein ACFRI7_36035 [Streptomyces sp. NPDC056716]|uniref:hypothetical protein n=1 Tax=unclassified Streptomyces TaxID=2593676 RepID=UPI0036A265F2
MPEFHVRTRLNWSFSARAGIGRPRRASTATRLARASVLRALLRAAARSTERRAIAPGHRHHHVLPHRHVRRRRTG